MIDDPELAACRILALDDHTIQVKIFQKILETYGYPNVVGLSDPTQCLPLHQESPFDLVIVDLDMPGLDGFGVIAQLTDHAQNDFLPILVVTGSADRKDMLRALELGARDFISRPVHREELIHRATHLLQIRLAYKKIPTALRPGHARIDRQAIQQGRILLLEDDNPQRMIMERILKAGGYGDVSSPTDFAALPSFLASQTTPFELVILDLHLPEITTQEVIQHIIQSTPRKMKPYILAVSSDDSNDVRWDAFRDGVWDFVNKPLERDIFLARVGNLIELRLLA